MPARSRTQKSSSRATSASCATGSPGKAGVSLAAPRVLLRFVPSDSATRRLKIAQTARGCGSVRWMSLLARCTSIGAAVGNAAFAHRGGLAASPHRGGLAASPLVSRGFQSLGFRDAGRSFSRACYRPPCGAVGRGRSMSVVASGERDVLLPREDGDNLAVAKDDGFTLSERPALVQFPCAAEAVARHTSRCLAGPLSIVCVQACAAQLPCASMLPCRTLTYFRPTSWPGAQRAVTPSSFTACPPLIRGSVVLNPPWGNHARPVGMGRLANDPAAKSANANPVATTARTTRRSQGEGELTAGIESFLGKGLSVEHDGDGMRGAGLFRPHSRDGLRSWASIPARFAVRVGPRTVRPVRRPRLVRRPRARCVHRAARARPRIGRWCRLGTGRLR